MLLSEADPEPRIDERAIARGRDRVVRGEAVLDPASRGGRVEVAHGLGHAHRVARRLDPDVGPPARVGSRCAEHEADDLATAGCNGSRGGVRGELVDRGARGVALLERSRKARLERAMGGVALCEQAGGVIEEPGPNGWISRRGTIAQRSATAVIREDDPA